MKVKIQKKVLKAATEVVNNVCCKLNSRYDSEAAVNVPSVMIWAKEKKAGIVAMNEYIMVRVALPAEIEEDGFFAVSAKRLADFIPSFSEEAVIKTQENSIFLYEGDESSPTVSAVIPCEDTGKFAISPDFNGEIIMKGTACKFAYCLGSVLSAVPSANVALPALCNLCMDYEGESISFIGFDSYQLIKKTIRLLNTNTTPARRMIMESESARCLYKILQKNKETVSFQASDKYLYIKGENIQIAVRLLETQFPDYQLLLNGKFDKEFSIDKDIFWEQIKTIKGIGNSKNPLPVLFRFNGNNLTLRFVTPDTTIVKNLPLASKGADPTPFKIMGKTLKNSAPYMEDKIKFLVNEAGLVMIKSGSATDYLVITRAIK